MGEKSMVEIQSSGTKSGTVRSRRPREHLTEAEIERLMTVARRGGRYGHRDATAILVAFRHGLRSSELVGLQWDQIDFMHKTIRINRVKNGTGSTHYLSNSELRALRRLQRENPPGAHVFVSERGGPVTTAWFRKMMARLGERAWMPFLIHPHTASSTPTRARIRGRCRPTWGTATSNPRSATRPGTGSVSGVGKGVAKMRPPKDEALWAALEGNLERCKAECAAIDREMKTLLAEGRADTDEGYAAQRSRFRELRTRRGEAVRKMLAADRAIINARWSRPAH
jgi:hypothetical protein